MKAEDLVVTPIKKTVEDWLNQVNYRDDYKYIPGNFALKFINFIKLVNGGKGEENKTPVLHYKMLDGLDSPYEYLANLIHRGGAKTTVMGEYLFLYIAVYGTLPFLDSVNLALYVSDSIENGVKNMRLNLEHRWSESSFLQTYIPKAKFTDIRWEFTNVAGKKFIVKGYGAKALSLDSVLYTDTGKTTIEDCRVGDKIYGPDGQLASITAKSEVFNKPMYRISLRDGRSIKVSEDHINSVVVNTNPNNTLRLVEKDLTTLELLKQPLTHTKLGNKNHKGVNTKSLVWVKNTKPLVYLSRAFPIDPYTLGVVLGDGRIQKPSGAVELTTHIDDLPTYQKHIPYTWGKGRFDKRNPATWTQSIRDLGSKLKHLGLVVHSKDKFIPEKYFYGSIEQRLSLLQGLMDTDGTVTKNGRTSFCSCSEQLLTDVENLVRSLGGIAQRSKKKFNTEIWLNMPLFRLERKLVRQRYDRKADMVAVVSIERIADEPSQCIAVDNQSHQFLADSYFRTHNTGVRGAKELGVRPQLALLDDLVSDEDARSPTIIASIEDTVGKAVNYALHPTRRKIIWNGTPFNQNDPLYKAVESGAWVVNVFPVCEKFPCTKEEFHGSWEDRFAYEFVKAQYDKAVNEGKIADFNQELMLRIISDEERSIKQSDISWYSRSRLLQNKGAFNWYITSDFATSEKQRADDSGISVWAVNNNYDLFWVDGVLKRQLMDKNFDDLFTLVQRYSPVMATGIETNGQQKGFISLIQREMMHRNVYFNLASDRKSGEPGIRSGNGTKFVRFNTYAVPLFKAHKFYFPEEMKDDPIMLEAINQLTLVTPGGFKSKKDDFLDTVSQLAEMPIHAPSESINMVKSSDGIYDDDDDNYEEDNIGSYIV